MAEIWFTSDSHFGHENIINFLHNGEKLRPFANAAEMDEAMVDRWNSVVKEQDKVYHLGDVVINKKHLQTVKRLNGSKRLIRGNHDIMKTKEYIEAGFKEVYGARVLEDCVLTHVPIHPDSIRPGRWGLNVHGHYHANKVMMPKVMTQIIVGEQGPEWEMVPDPRYLCVCVEHTDFSPINYDELRARVREQYTEAQMAIPENFREAT